MLLGVLYESDYSIYCLSKIGKFTEINVFPLFDQIKSKGTVVNRALLSMQCGSLKIELTVSLNDQIQGEGINLSHPPGLSSRFFILHVKLKNPILPNMFIVYFIIKNYLWFPSPSLTNTTVRTKATFRLKSSKHKTLQLCSVNRPI